MIDLTKMELFENLLVFKTEKDVIDLHNDFKCQSIEYDREVRSIKFIFKDKGNDLVLQFNDAVLNKVNLLFNRTVDSSILNNFYRGRFELDGKLFEYTEEGRGYYYLEFEEGDIFEIFSLKAFLIH
jgi:hypothetical protein